MSNCFKVQLRKTNGNLNSLPTRLPLKAHQPDSETDIGTSIPLPGAGFRYFGASRRRLCLDCAPLIANFSHAELWHEVYTRLIASGMLGPRYCQEVLGWLDTHFPISVELQLSRTYAPVGEKAVNSKMEKSDVIPTSPDEGDIQ